ncbi:hypothetical protein [uncultured Akkermansia sp.]|uniref:hypothetical protein n=1 Tax=uncultured Akkermansia sp. TaxID=512294 RepID=UPI0026253375|nr:hypothetical protein [uncultured Akkermansia sp.]
MKKIHLAALTAALTALAVLSCSPIVAEYTYTGSVTKTGSNNRSRVLSLKEYRDGTVSGNLIAPSTSAMEPYSCGNVGGRIDGRRITFYRTSMGDSYLGAKMAVAGNSAGTTIAYNGNINRNRRYLSGKWHAANDHRSCIRGGSFFFNLTHINGRPVPKPKTPGGTTTPESIIDEPGEEID